MNIEHISVSRFGVWNNCPCQYKYKYHFKIIPPGPEPFYFVYGKIVHKIAEEYVTRKGVSPLAEVAMEVLDGKIPIERDEKEKKEVFAPSLPPAYRKRLPENLRSIKKLTDQIGTEGLLEHQFNYDLDPPNNKKVKGFIDRLINKGDKWFILDYKTTKAGQWRKDAKSIVHDLQLRLYARVVQREFNVPAENIHAALYYLEDGSLISTGFDQKSLLTAETCLLEAYNDIVAMPPEAVFGNVGDHCYRCEYKDMCPFFNQV